MAYDKTYSVRWYGPFKTVDEIRDFENENKEIGFQIYIINGYKPRAKYSSYYCGQTQRSVYKRLTDANHHINDYNSDRIDAIWIGSITNVAPTKTDINIVEKIITAQLKETYTSRFILNETNTLFPKYNVYVINIWHNKKNGYRMQRYPQYSIPSELPDVIGHEYEKLIDAHCLFSAGKINWYKTD